MGRRGPACLAMLTVLLVASACRDATSSPAPVPGGQTSVRSRRPPGTPRPATASPGSPDAGAVERYVFKDGHLLAIAAGNPDVNGIFTLRPNGSHFHRLPLPRELGPEAVAWSPDGRRLAFTATDLRRHESSNLYVVNADGTGLRQLTHGKLGLGDIAWSPDGTQIAAVGGRGGTPHVLLVDVDGGGLRPILTRYWVGSVAWGPDGRLWFSAVVPAKPGHAKHTGIWTTMDPEAATAHLVARPSPLPHICCVAATLTATSADGRQVLVVAYPRHGDVSLVSRSGHVRVLGRCLLRTCVKIRTGMMGMPFQYAATLGPATLEPGGRRLVLLAGPGLHYAYVTPAQSPLHPRPLRIPGDPTNVISVSWRTIRSPVAPSPETTGPAPAAQAENFGPNAVSFVSADRGWALSPTACRGCGRLTETSDAGRHWTTRVRALPLPGGPRSLVEGRIGMYFTDVRHGYIYTAGRCGPCLLTTSDGGRSWAPTSLPAVTQLVSSNQTGQGGATIYALASEGATNRLSLYRSTPGSSRWTRLDLPATASSIELAAQGHTVAVLANSRLRSGRLWVSTNRGRSWTKRPVPCRPNRTSAAAVSIALGHPAAMLIDCFNNQQSQQAQHTRHRIYGSSDGGRHWTRLGDPPQTGDPPLLADNGAGHTFLATESGTGDLLASTLDGGRHWHKSITSTPGFFGWSPLRFLNPRTGFIFGPTHYAPERLYRTIDGGRTWHPVALPRPH